MIKQTYMLFYNKKFNFKPVKSFAVLNGCEVFYKNFYCYTMKQIFPSERLAKKFYDNFCKQNDYYVSFYKKLNKDELTSWIEKVDYEIDFNIEMDHLEDNIWIEKGYFISTNKIGFYLEDFD